MAKLQAITAIILEQDLTVCVPRHFQIKFFSATFHMHFNRPNISVYGWMCQVFTGKLFAVHIASSS